MESPAVTSIADARAGLSQTLRRFRTGVTDPVVLGSHRRPEAVIMPYAAFEAAAESRAPTLAALRARRRLIHRLAHAAGLTDVRVTGSVARGEATTQSDIDLIVTPGPEATLFSLAQFADDVEQLTGRPVDVLSGPSLDAERDAGLLADAVEL